MADLRNGGPLPQGQCAANLHKWHLQMHLQIFTYSYALHDWQHNFQPKEYV